MKKKLLQWILACFFLIVYTIVYSQNQKYSRVKIYGDDAALLKLSKLGLAVDHGEIKKGHFLITDFSQQEIQLIQQTGLMYEILIDDVVRHYKEQNFKSNNKAAPVSSANSCVSSVKDYPVPSNFSLGSLAGYFTYNEMLAHLDTMASKFPTLITQRQQIDTILTHEGRPVYWLKISDNPSTDENEPEILYTALHHAREPGSLSQLIFYMYYLLENYGTNPEVTYLINNTEMYFIPCVNPDGYIYNQTIEPSGGGMWRKNRSNNPDGSEGVDLNRNYGHMWGFDDIGSSPDGNSQTYRGTSAFSEPETQITRNFCLSHQFKIAMNYHTYGNLLIYPWGYIAGLLTPDSTAFEDFSSLMTTENSYYSGTGDQTVGYIVNGDSDDWMYGEQSQKNKIISFTPEAGSSIWGFWPPSSEIIGICKENLRMNLNAANLLFNVYTISDVSPTVISEDTGFLYYNVKNLGLSDTLQATVNFFSVDSILNITDTTKTYSTLNLTAVITDSIAYTIDSILINGDVFSYGITINNGVYSFSDTITKIYGQKEISFYDSCNSLTNWQTPGWGVSTSNFYSYPASITDSPSGNYSPNEYTSVTSSTFNLKNIKHAFLTFYAKWDVEERYDYAQVKVSPDNGFTWNALCGKYTSNAGIYQDYGNPIYQGNQSNWVFEEINLSEYIGKEILIRFDLTSDGGDERDGFYFDDLNIVTVGCTNTPIANFTYIASGLSLSFINTSSASTNVLWNFGDSSTSTTLNPTHLYSDTGKYTICLMLENACGTDTICKTITITNIGFPQFNTAGKEFIIFPNPANDNLNIEYTGKNLEFTVTIYDMLGEMVYFNKTKTSFNQDISSFTDGVYFIKIQCESEVINKKLVVLRQ